MRIALLTSQWPGVRLGGIGVYTLNGACGLAKAGHEVHVFTLPLPADVPGDLPAGVKVHAVEEASLARKFPKALPMGGMLKYQMALRLALGGQLLALHRELPFDIVEAPEYEALAQMLTGEAEFPVVTHLHSGVAIARAVDQSRVDQEQALIEEFELDVIAAADAVCAPSQSVVVETRRAYGLPDLAREARVIPIPFAAAAASFELPADDAPVVYVGRLELLKGAHLLAEAAPAFLRAHPRARLRIIGPDTMTAPDSQGRRTDGSMADWMRARIGGGFAERVTFLGQQNSLQIADELRRAAFVVIPSLRESYSYVCCEALAAGRAVVVSSDIGATEVAGEAGVVFRRGDAGELAGVMGRLWSDSGLRAELSRRAWERARRELAPERAIAQRLAFYEEVLAARRMHGTQPGERRVAALPEGHTARLLVALSQAHGDAALLPELLQRANLPTATLTPVMRLLKVLNGHAEGRSVRFHLYGAGRHTARLLLDQSAWQAQGHELAGLIDDHPRFREDPRCQGLPVMACAAAAAQLGPEGVVVLSTDAMEEQFWRNTEGLRGKGITVYRLYA